MKQKSEKSRNPNQHKVHFYRQIAFAFVGAAIVVLGGILYFSLSQSVIRVTPALEEVMADFNILVKKGSDLTDEGVNAELIFTEVTVEESADAELLEEGEDQQATGTVKLKNTSNSDQPLIATTRLLSEDEVLFRLQDDVTVPANGEVEAEVFADEPGKQGEIEPSMFKIPGLNQARQQEVFAESENKMTGGTKAVYQVTENIITETKKKATENLITQAKEILAEEDEINLEELLSDAVHLEILEEETTPEEGTNAQQVTVKMRAIVAFVISNEDAIFQLAQSKLFTKGTIGYELSSSNEGSFNYSLTNFDAEKERVQLRVTLDGSRRINSNYPLLDRASLIGKTPDQVKSELEADQAIEQVDVSLRPFWLRKIPRLVDHVYIQFN